MIIKIFFAIIVGAMLVGLVWYFVVYSPALIAPNENNTNNSSVQVITDEQMYARQPGTILSKDNDVEVSDSVLINNDKTEQIDTGFYEITDNPAAYGIFYLAEGGNMTVNLYGSDTRSSRLAAEKYLLNNLNFTKKDLCGLAVTVMTNIYENEKLAGINLGFSFCPGSIEL